MDPDDDDDDGDFDRPAGAREDEAHDGETGVSRSARDFDEDERQVFGFNSGMYYPRNGRGADEYFGEAEAQERQSTAPSVVFGQDQRRGHRNRESSSAASQSASDRVRGRFDPDTQAFNLDFGAPPSAASMARRPAPPSGEVSVAPAPIVAEAPRSVAPSRRSSTKSSTTKRSTATRSEKPPHSSGSTGTKHYGKLPTYFAEKNVKAKYNKYVLAPTGSVRIAPNPVLPTRQSQLPTTREGFDALAKKINASGGIDGTYIQVYAGSSVANIKKNFVKRLGLAGKY
jgi:hypothetical protein